MTYTKHINAVHLDNWNQKNTDGTYMSQTWDYNHSYSQCWHLQIGVKYYFN